MKIDLAFRANHRVLPEGVTLDDVADTVAAIMMHSRPMLGGPGAPWRMVATQIRNALVWGTVRIPLEHVFPPPNGSPVVVRIDDRILGQVLVWWETPAGWLLGPADFAARTIDWEIA